MTSALKVHDIPGDAVQLDVTEAFAAAILCASKAGKPLRSVLDYLSKSDWEQMDAKDDCILVFEPV